MFPLLFDIGEPAKARCPGGDGRRANFYDPGFQHCKGHRIVRIPRDKPQKPFWGCATCGRLWARLRFLIIDVQAGLLDECEGEGARESWLRGRSFKLIWAKLSAASRKRLSACISVSRSERRMLASGAHKLRKERGPTDVRHTQAGKRKGHDKALTEVPMLRPKGRKASASSARRATAPAQPRETHCEGMCKSCGARFRASSAKLLSRRLSQHRHAQHPELQDVKPSWFRRKGRFVWPCTVCKAQVATDSFKQLQDARNRHILGEHPIVARWEFRTLQGRWGHHHQASQSGCARKLKQVLDINKQQLLEDGDVEAQPGPSSLSQQACSLQIWTVNVAGMSNTFDCLHCVFHDRPHVILLQEVRAKADEIAQLKNFLRRNGYKGWYQEGWVDKLGRAWGGVLTAARDDVRASFLNKVGATQGQLLSIDLGGCVISNVWQRPQEVSEGGMQKHLQEHMAMATTLDAAWLVGGDWNEPPGENVFAGFGNIIAAGEGDAYAPTRWSGRRCIDYFIHIDERRWEPAASTARILPYRWGDHKGVALSYELPLFVAIGACMVPTCDYGRPSGVCADRWREALANAWASAQVPGPTSSEEEWAWFNATAEQCCQRAFQECGMQPPRAGCRAKGSAPVFTQGPAKTARERPHTFQQRKLSKQIGRLREYLFQRDRGRADHQLWATLQRTWPQQLPKTFDLQVALLESEALLSEAKRCGRRQGLKDWKESMAKEGKECTRWLKQDGARLPACLKTDTGIANSIDDIFGAIRDSWRKIWRRDPSCPELLALSSREVRAPLDDGWRLEAKHLLAAARQKAGGSAGTDGWSGLEISDFPIEAWAAYLVLWTRWSDRNLWPASLATYRQIFLPKGAVENDGDPLNPIPV